MGWQMISRFLTRRASLGDSPKAVSFLDGAKAHADARRAWMKSQRQMQEVERSLSLDELAAMFDQDRGLSK